MGAASRFEAGRPLPSGGETLSPSASGSDEREQHLKFVAAWLSQDNVVDKH